jgi:hypothetical protein
MGQYWILDNQKPVEADLMTWAIWFEKAERHVADTRGLPDDARVSTSGMRAVSFFPFGYVKYYIAIRLAMGRHSCLKPWCSAGNSTRSSGVVPHGMRLCDNTPLPANE